MCRQFRADRVVGRRQDVDHAGRDVGRVRNEPAERERRPRSVGRALQDHRAPGRECRRELRERELDRVVVRGDGADDAGRFPLDPAVVTAGERVALAEVLDEVVAVEQVGVPLHDVGGAVELRSVGDRDRRADLVHEDLAERFRVVDQCLVELAQAARAELLIA